MRKVVAVFLLFLIGYVPVAQSRTVSESAIVAPQNLGTSAVASSLLVVQDSPASVSAPAYVAVTMDGCVSSFALSVVSVQQTLTAEALLQCGAGTGVALSAHTREVAHTSIVVAMADSMRFTVLPPVVTHTVIDRVVPEPVSDPLVPVAIVFPVYASLRHGQAFLKDMRSAGVVEFLPLARGQRKTLSELGFWLC